MADPDPLWFRRRNFRRLGRREYGPWSRFYFRIIRHNGPLVCDLSQTTNGLQLAMGRPDRMGASASHPSQSLFAQFRAMVGDRRRAAGPVHAAPVAGQLGNSARTEPKK